MGKLYWDSKDPNEYLDYTINWSDRIVTDTISACTWINITPGITISNQVSTATQTSLWITGGTANHIYDLTNRITTSSGRIMDQTVRIEVWEK